MNEPVPVNPPELRSTIVAASGMPWQRTEFDGIEMKILYQDAEGRSTILFRMAPGAVVPLHEHTALEQTFMLEGSLQDSEGSCGAGDFVWRPGGNVHVAHAPQRGDVHLDLHPPEPLFRRHEVFHCRRREQVAPARIAAPQQLVIPRHRVSPSASQMTGSSGVSGTPQPLDSITAASAILDHPLSASRRTWLDLPPGRPCSE
jgi:quercetin dioxygenase-like cupin family protein